MDSFELNKIAGAVLGAATFVMLTSFGAELLYAERKTAKAGYELPLPEGAVVASAAPAAAAVEPIAVRLASADKAKGEAAFKQCAACHSNDKGGANRIGPNLWNVVGRAKGAHPGFSYSAAMKTAAAKGDAWDFEKVDKFVEAPKGYLPGTSMSYAGLSNPKARADLVAYLSTLNDAPPEFPKP